MVDKQLLKQRIIDLELSIESKLELIMKLRKEVKLERTQLMASKKLLGLLGGE